MGWRYVVAVAVLVGASARPGFSDLIPGGGKSAADCYAELDVQGAGASTKVVCTDGDPACDTDGQCQGVCTFAVGLCLNQTNVDGCVPKALKKPVKVSGAPLSVLTATDASPICGPSSDVAVALKGRKKKRGKKRITVTVVVTGKPGRDRDRITLTCERREGECPTTTTTTTTLPPPDATALLTGSRLAAFSTVDPAVFDEPAAVTGLTAGDELVSIDRRPQNGILYGLGYNDAVGTVQLYAIRPASGVATPIGTTGTFVASDGSTPVPVVGTRFGIDFNPTADRVRVVTDAGQNFRINPNTGAFIDGDLGGVTVPGLNMDGVINGALSSIDEAAYTNDALNASVTTLYTLDATALCIQNPPNGGTQTTCQALSPAVSTVLGFDISPGIEAPASNVAANGTGLAILTLAGQSNQVLASIDLASGAVGDPTAIGTGGIVGMAIQKPAATSMVALDSVGGHLLRFTSADPGSAVTVTINGVVGGESMVGIDYRPSTGQLFGLGINGGSDTGTLYLLDPQTGAATVVGVSSGIGFVDGLGSPVDLPGAGYGFDFNPAVDRIRVVTGTGLNFRVNPNTGAPVDGDSLAAGIQPDGGLNGATGAADGVAYTNGAGVMTEGTVVTTLYAIDASTDGLYIQNPPNAGTETAVIPITLNGASLDFSSAGGFDIPSDVQSTATSAPVTSGSGFAVLTVANIAHLYRIDLVAGAAADLGVIGAGLRLDGLAIGQVAVK